MPRMGVGLLTAFGFLALGLASIGLYGVLAYSVAQRKREIGLRMALGATRSSVLRLVLGQGMSLVAVGIILGSAGALAAGRFLSSMLFGLWATDPLSFAGAALVLCVFSLAACYVPGAWRNASGPARGAARSVTSKLENTTPAVGVHADSRRYRSRRRGPPSPDTRAGCVGPRPL